MLNDSIVSAQQINKSTAKGNTSMNSGQGSKPGTAFVNKSNMYDGAYN
jgi:hypothetical protein